MFMAAEKLSVSFEAKLAAEIRKAAAREGLSVSEWLADAAAAKARRRHLRDALDEYAAADGPLSDAEIDTIVREARQRSVVTQPRRKRSR
jgi:hypothetical protein